MAPFGSVAPFGEGLKSGPSGPILRPQLTSCGEQRPLQAVLVSWPVTTWQLVPPTCVTVGPVWGKHAFLMPSGRVSSAPFLHRLTEPIESVDLYASGPCASSCSAVGAKLSASCLHRGGDRQCQLRDSGLSP